MPYPYREEKRRALEILRRHQMTIEHDEGEHRSLYFGRPGSSAYHFRINTWPGHLCISGDMGTYVFSRLRDMFEFHANGDDWAAMPIRINASYWAEKIQHGSSGGRGSVQYSRIAVDRVKTMAVERFREIPLIDFEPGWRLTAFRDLRDEVLENISEDDSAESVVAKIDRYSIPAYCLKSDQPYRLDEETAWFWDVEAREYEFHFLFACYAIVWGIKRYAQHRDGRTQADHDRAVLRGEK